MRLRASPARLLSPPRSLIVGACVLCAIALCPSAESAAQTDEPDTSLVVNWWVIGTGGVLLAGNDDGDTLSATVGQAVIDTTSDSDELLGKATRLGINPTRLKPTVVHLGFWLPQLSEEEEPEAFPTRVHSSGSFALTGYPNPFTERATLSFATDSRARLQLSVYSATGQIVRSLIDHVSDPGKHAIEWDGSDDSGSPAPSGVYHCRLSATFLTDAQDRDEHLSITLTR